MFTNFCCENIVASLKKKLKKKNMAYLLFVHVAKNVINKVCNIIWWREFYDLENSKLIIIFCRWRRTGSSLLELTAHCIAFADKFNNSDSWNNTDVGNTVSDLVDALRYSYSHRTVRRPEAGYTLGVGFTCLFCKGNRHNTQ